MVPSQPISCSTVNFECGMQTQTGDGALKLHFKIGNSLFNPLCVFDIAHIAHCYFEVEHIIAHGYFEKFYISTLLRFSYGILVLFYVLLLGVLTVIRSSNYGDIFFDRRRKIYKPDT